MNPLRMTVSPSGSVGPVSEEAVLRYSAFTEEGEGGNPAGVVVDARGLTDERMLAIAAEVGYSETAFVFPREDGGRVVDVRFFSPQAEVPFCGHATIATAVVLAERDGPGDLVFAVQSGEVPVLTRHDADGSITATLTSVTPHVSDLSAEDLDRVLDLLGWSAEDLDPALPPRLAYAGVHHIVLAATTRERLADLDYDFEGLKAFMLERDLTTIDLVWRADPLTFHARNPFPVGGKVEDPATGAAAAALGAYLREVGAIEPPARLTIFQGADMGRPSRLLVDVEPDRPEIRVTGRAAPIE